MLPGVGHCGGGRGPGNAGVNYTTEIFLTALEDWVENDVAPEGIVAEHYTDEVVDMSRPLCPYPEVAVYDGVGDPNEDASFFCQDLNEYDYRPGPWRRRHGARKHWRGFSHGPGRMGAK
jgi:feruloyl esterase